MRQAALFVPFFACLLLTACFRDTITEFEDCVSEVTLIATEATPTMELIRGSSRWSSFEIGRNEHYVNVTFSDGPLPGGVESTSLPIGTEVDLDGYVAAHNRVAVESNLYFRGDIEGRTVWITHRDAQKLVDPANEDSLKKLGVLDEAGKEVVYANWECPNTR